MVCDACASGKVLFFFVQLDFDVVVGTLLPILRTGGAGSETDFGWSRPDFFKLPEGIFVELNGVRQSGPDHPHKKSEEFHIVNAEELDYFKKDSDS